MKYWGALLMGGMIAAAGPAQPVAGVQPLPKVIAGIAPGLWQLRDIDAGRSAPPICIHAPAELVQLRHPGASCPRVVIAAGVDEATVQYRCPGAGFGRTMIRVESASVLKLETQGFAAGQPFDLEYEARRVGACH